jgi:hypothetical protein
MPRDITLTELARLNVLDAAATDLRVQTEDNHIERYSDKYEQAVDRFVAVARPHLLPTPAAPFSQRPVGAAGVPSPCSGSAASSPDLASVRDPRSPDAAAVGAISFPGGGTTFTAGLLTYEGLHDALTSFFDELREGSFQPDFNADRATEMLQYIIRHAEQHNEVREAAE